MTDTQNHRKQGVIEPVDVRLWPVLSAVMRTSLAHNCSEIPRTLKKWDALQYSTRVSKELMNCSIFFGIQIHACIITASSQAFLAEILLSSPQKTFLSKAMCIGSKYPKKYLIQFWKKLHWLSDWWSPECCTLWISGSSAIQSTPSSWRLSWLCDVMPRQAHTLNLQSPYYSTDNVEQHLVSFPKCVWRVGLIVCAVDHVSPERTSALPF